MPKIKAASQWRDIHLVMPVLHKTKFSPNTRTLLQRTNTPSIHMKNLPIVKIPTLRERDLLFFSLYGKYGMHLDSFDVNAAGEVYPNHKWWRKRGILKKSVLIEVHCYVAGWVDGRRAAENKAKVIAMWKPGPIPEVEISGEQKMGPGDGFCQQTG